MHQNTILSLLAIALLAVTGAIAQDEPQKTLFLEARPATVSATIPGEGFLLDRTDYLIGRQDLLEISVFDVEELSQTVRVADDGSITMPLLGRLVVDGLTKTKLEQVIAGLLEKRYVRDPQVTVFVKEYESKRVAVSGAGKKPGSYEMLGRKTLLEMLSMAGGIDRDPGKDIVVFRKGKNDATHRIPVSLRRLIYEADPALNIVVEPGDIIYVPTVERVRIFVAGAVRNPDVYEVPSDEPVTVLKAVTLAGGITNRAGDKKVQIIRTEPEGERVTYIVNLRKIQRGKIDDPILQKGDIVFVPESFF